MAAKDLITVIILYGHGNEEWLKKATDSLEIQTYGIENLEVLVVDNKDRKKSIGKAWNEAIAQAKGKYCFFLGDDDFIQPAYIDSLCSTLKETKKEIPNVACCTAFVTRFEGEGKHTKINKSDTYATGMIETEYARAHPFNEERINRVDTLWYSENRNNVTMAYWNNGYFYRGHSNQISKCGIMNAGQQFDNVFLTKFPHFINNYIGSKPNAILVSVYDHLLVRNAKMVFCDFAEELAVHVSHATTEAKKVLRVHRFEAYTDNMLKIKWEAFDKVIFTSCHVKRYVEAKLSKTIKGAIVNPVGVDVRKFNFQKKAHNNKIGICGYINPKKGFVMLKMLAKTFPKMEFHVLGAFQTEELRHYLTEKTFPNIYISTWMENPSSWYQGMSYIMSMSLVESQQMTILEGMACGCKPLVYEHWIGSNDVYKPEHLWGTMRELAALITGDFTPDVYRQFVVDNYNQATEFDRLNEYIGG